jgi:hypothetical protein
VDLRIRLDQTKANQILHLFRKPAMEPFYGSPVYKESQRTVL